MTHSWRPAPWACPVLADRVDYLWSGYPGRGPGIGGCLVGGGAEVAEAGMPAAGVVPPFDVGEDRLVGPCFGGPGLSVEQFGFDGGEERLGHRVVPALACAADRKPHPGLGGGARELSRGVLATPIGMENHPGRRAALGECGA